MDTVNNKNREFGIEKVRFQKDSECFAFPFLEKKRNLKNNFLTKKPLENTRTLLLK
ncbi:hypothetical protein NU08_0244 [Flavobacterium anhuiense]|uniref:Uncharacterized protein n=1 Tax=Flavobacterium anhuiense TaxID=459526 RepID=A0A444W4I4_9FLAO|nr:hypothetical protein NU08_0244 [Flavobacterium anhuiense]